MSQFATWEDHYNNIAAARKNGLAVIYSTDTTLLLDLDTDEQLAQYENMKKMLFKRLGKREVERWKSKSGNTHIVVELNQPLTLELRIGLQVILGSDPTRGFHEMLQVIEKANPIALFKPATKIDEKPDDLPF